MWLNSLSANKTSVAIGGIIKEMKPGKILVEDDEGKVSVAGFSGRLGPLSAPIFHRTLSPTPALVLLPNTRSSRAQVGGLHRRTDYRGFLSW